MADEQQAAGDAAIQQTEETPSTETVKTDEVPAEATDGEAQAGDQAPAVAAADETPAAPTSAAKGGKGKAAQTDAAQSPLSPEYQTPINTIAELGAANAKLTDQLAQAQADNAVLPARVDELVIENKRLDDDNVALRAWTEHLAPAAVEGAHPIFITPEQAVVIVRALDEWRYTVACGHGENQHALAIIGQARAIQNSEG